MRCMLLPLLVVAACGSPVVEDHHAPPLEAGCSDIGAFEIAAPRPDLHYAPSLDVYVDESELQGELSLTMVDDLGNPYEWTTDSTAPYPGDAGTWWNQDKFHYDLAPSHRYTLTVSHCATIQTVVFFTSAS